MELDQLLKEYGWSQRELSERIKVHRVTISRWINDAHPVPEIVLLYLRILLAQRKKTEDRLSEVLRDEF